MDYLFLIIFSILWCTVHSGMISLTITDYVKSKFGNNYKFYRIFYNFIAIGTFFPLLAYKKSIESPILFGFDGYMIILQVSFVLLSLGFFITGAKKYDMMHFIGLGQLISGQSHSTLSHDGTLNTSGILSITRHPWYFASIIFIWSYNTNIYLSTFVLNTIFTIYLFVGAHLEEKKLVKEFGDTYLDYQKIVPMIFPKLLYNSLTVR